jgi:ABC-2 type transport system permease protein
MTTRILTLELKNFLAARGVLAGLLLMLLAGIAALEFGRTTMERQRAVLAQSEALQREHLAQMLALHGGNPADGPGNLLYYTNFFTRREPSRFAPLAVGLRDLHPYNLKVRMLALEGQLYDAEVGNPESQALGNFDLTFLLTFLYPLLLIAFLHNTLSSEQESGSWPLLRSHPVSPMSVLLRKAALRFLPVPLVWLLTLSIAVVRLSLPLDGRLLDFTAVSCLYLTFWFMLALFVMAFQRTSNFNALALLCSWLVFTILLPVAINLGVAHSLPASGAFEIAVRQREGYHNKWDRPRQETMQAFYANHPQHAAYQAPPDKFSWGWYYAMQQMGDEEAARAAADWKRTIEERERRAAQLAWLSPAALVQSALTRLAASGLATHLDYLDSVRAHHTRLRAFFYPYLFRDAPIPAVDWRRLPRHQFTDEAQPVTASGEFGKLLVLSLALLPVSLRLLATRL